jgi:hypothetical protein
MPRPYIQNPPVSQNEPGVFIFRDGSENNPTPVPKGLVEATTIQGSGIPREGRSIPPARESSLADDLVPTRARALADHAHSVVQRPLREHQTLVSLTSQGRF